MLDMPANTVEPSLTWSPIGQKKLAALTGYSINKGFFNKEMYGPFCQVAKNNEAAILPRWP